MAQDSSNHKSTPHKSPPPAPKPPPADYSQEPFVIEQYHTTARFENDGTSERDLAVRVRVQSDAGVQQLGELVFGYNSANEVMDVRFVRVKKKDGSVVTATADAVKDMTASVARDAPEYTDYKEKHVTVPSLHAGDTIEYEIATRTVTALAPGNFWFDYAFVKDAIVLDERLDVNLPPAACTISRVAAHAARRNRLRRRSRNSPLAARQSHAPIRIRESQE